jgi:hypothetical protein
MQRLAWYGGFLLLSTALFVPTLAGGAQKTEGGGDEPKKQDKKTGEPEKLYYAGKYTGKITQVDTGTTKDFTLHVSGKVQEMNQGEYNNMQTAMRQAQEHYQRYLTAKTVQGKQNELNSYQNAMNRVSQHQAKLYHLKDVKADYKFRPAENVYYRTLHPEAEYDDKGNVKDLTAKEKELLKYPPMLREKVNVDTKKLSKQEKADLDALKGVYPRLPGYFAEPDVLRTNVQADVYTKIPPKDVKKKTDDDPVLPSDRQEVVVIVIINSPPPGAKKSN